MMQEEWEGIVGSGTKTTKKSKKTTNGDYSAKPVDKNWSIGHKKVTSPLQAKDFYSKIC